MKKVLMGLGLLSTLAMGMGETYPTEKLISGNSAKKILENDKNVVLIDVRPKVKFMMSNVKGSYNMWREDMQPQDNRYGEVTGMRASREEMEAKLNKMGVDENTTLLLTGNGLDEYRLWWILDLYGFENIKIIDGGYEALKESGIKTTFGGGASEKKGNYHFPEIADKDTLANIDEIKNNISNNHVAILDTRSDKEFLGEDLKKGAFVKGRIPNSIHIEWTDVAEKNLRLKPLSQIKEMYEKCGITPDKEIIPYCQSAVRSAHTTFVLKEILKYPNVKNYDGSWIEWSFEAKNKKVDVITGE